MDALASADFPPTLLADDTHAVAVGRDMCGADRAITRFQLMSVMHLNIKQVNALDRAAHKYLCKK